MTAVLEWTETDVPGIGEAGVNRIWTEVDDSGIILREIGLDSTGGVVYIAPAQRGEFRYGLFDLQVLESNAERRTVVPRDVFERVWTSAVSTFGARAGRTVS